MMKGWCIFIVVILLGNSYVAQAQIDKNTYSRWVDEVCDEYVDAYTKKKNNDPLHERIQELRDYIENKKRNFKEGWTDSDLIENLISLPNNRPSSGGTNSFAGYLEDITTTLRDDFEQRLTEENSATAATPVPTATESPNTKNVKESSSWSKWIIGIVCMLPLLYLGFKYQRREGGVFSKKEGSSAHGHHSKISDDDVPIRVFEARMRKLEERIEQLEKRGIRINPAHLAEELMKNESFNNLLLSDLRRGSYKTESLPPPTNTNAPREQRCPNPCFLYADTINNGEFYRVGDGPTEDTVYELRQLSEKSATFRVFPEASAKVLRRPNFLEGCDVQKIGEHGVETVELGEAILDQGVWTIRKRAKVRFV